MLGCKVPLDLGRNTTSFWSGKVLINYHRTMDIQIVDDQHNGLVVGIIFIDNSSHNLSKVMGSAVRSCTDLALTLQQLNGEKEIGSAMTHMLIILKSALFWLHGKGHT